MRHNDKLLLISILAVLVLWVSEARADTWWKEPKPEVKVEQPNNVAIRQVSDSVEMIAPVISPLQSPLEVPVPVGSIEAQMYVFCREHKIPHPSEECFNAWNIYASRD
jgi:hypothetical protein